MSKQHEKTVTVPDELVIKPIQKKNNWNVFERYR
jgi:hypothetical protein